MKTRNSNFRIPLRLKIFLQRIVFVLAILAMIVLCGLLATGAWNALVSIVNGVIEGGLATIVSSVVVVALLYYCVLPIAAFLLFVGISVLLHNL